MDFTWDENKRLKTIADRGLDFLRAEDFFDGRKVVHLPTPRHGEDRWKSIAEIDGKSLTVIWTWRQPNLHIISMRRSHGQEIRTYRALFG